jgi:hypothetical protein
MRYIVIVIVLVALAIFPAPLLAVSISDGGFWTGFVDGFLSLFKFLLGPITNVTLTGSESGTWGYTIGYYLGVLVFLGAAGAAASSQPVDLPEVRVKPDRR